MFTLVYTVREALKTFGRLLFGKLSTWIFELIMMSPRGSDTKSSFTQFVFSTFLVIANV